MVLNLNEADEDLQSFERWTQKYFQALNPPSFAGLPELHQAMQYSSLSGGKRFRPRLVLSTLRALGKDPQKGLPYALAVELIHTYSLIHDDLPLMDDDDLRRGQPTNHKVFGEAMALLAGDALLTEAFQVLSKGHRNQPSLGLQLIELLSGAAGVRGMVGGQAVDITLTETPSLERLHFQHALKTGALIQAAVEGAAWIAEVSAELRQQLSQFGQHLGLAFQLADDLQDHDPEDQEDMSFVALIGLEKTRELLKSTSQQALQHLQFGHLQNSILAELVEYNLTR